MCNACVCVCTRRMNKRKSTAVSQYWNEQRANGYKITFNHSTQQDILIKS